jgi:hypothetical protein
MANMRGQIPERHVHRPACWALEVDAKAGQFGNANIPWDRARQLLVDQRRKAVPGVVATFAHGMNVTGTSVESR